MAILLQTVVQAVGACLGILTQILALATRIIPAVAFSETQIPQLRTLEVFLETKQSMFDYF